PAALSPPLPPSNWASPNPPNTPSFPAWTHTPPRPSPTAANTSNLSPSPSSDREGACSQSPSPRTRVIPTATAQQLTEGRWKGRGEGPTATHFTQERSLPINLV